MRTALSPELMRRLYLGLIVFFCLCMLSVLYTRFMPSAYTVDAVTVAPETLSFSLDTAKHKGQRFIIEGWAVKRGKAIQTFDTLVLLKSPQGVFYRLPVQMRRRPDVTAYFKEENYDACGFSASAMSSFLHQKGPFSVYLLYRGNGENLLVNTGATL